MVSMTYKDLRSLLKYPLLNLHVLYVLLVLNIRVSVSV